VVDHLGDVGVGVGGRRGEGHAWTPCKGMVKEKISAIKASASGTPQT
jgi:hypothetical protein